MSDFWSFYEFSNLMEARKFKFAKPQQADLSNLDSLMGAPVEPMKKKGQVPAAPAAEAPPAAAPETAPPAVAKKPIAAPPDGGRDVLQDLPRANKAVAKGQEHKALEEMPEGALKDQLAARIKQGRDMSEKIMALNDINRNWLTGYWVMIDTLRKMGYDVPEIPMEEAPRWVPTGDGGFAKGDYETNGGSPDGPMVTVNNKSNPYNVDIADKKDMRKLLKAAIKLTKSGEDVESENPDKEKWLALAKKRDRGLTGMDMQAGKEGEATQDAMQSVGKAIKKKRGEGGPRRQDLAGYGKNVRTKGFRPEEEKLEHEMNEWLQYNDILEVMYS